MSDSVDIATRTQRFNEAVRAFAQPSPRRDAKLMPFKEGILELRQKGASLKLIRELLATIDVAVGTDTIARFLADVNGEPAPQRSGKRPNRARSPNPPPTRSQPVDHREADPPSTPRSFALPTPTQTPPPAPVATTPAERPRIRGPRIADPSNL
jgi:hypothetical protein